jgi:hypothetical protein
MLVSVSIVRKTEQVCVAVGLHTSVPVLDSNSVRRPTILTEVFRGFPQSIQENSRVVQRLGH